MTLSLAFDKVSLECPAAAELLNACAFLASNAIPEEIFLQEGGLCTTLTLLSSDEILFDNALQSARRLSLIHRNPQNKTWSVHRLIQEVLKRRMSSTDQNVLCEHIVHALNLAFPDPEFSLWEVCDKLLPHMQSGLETALISSSADVGTLSDKVAVYLYQRGLYHQAEAFALSSVGVRRQLLGPTHTDIAESLNDLGAVQCELGKYEEAEQCLKEAISIRESLFGVDHHSLMLLLNTLAMVYSDQARYQEAENLHEQVVRILIPLEKNYTDQVPATLNNLANLYSKQGRYIEAEEMLSVEMTLTKKKFGDEHPVSAKVIDNLGLVLQEQGRYKQALTYHKQALYCRLKVLQTNHPDIAISYNNLGLVYYELGLYDKSEEALKSALSI